MSYNSKVRQIFSERLKYLMLKNDIRSKDLVEKCNIDKSKVSSYINGRYMPNQATMNTLCNFFNVDVSYLLGLSENQNKKVKRINVYSSIHAGIPTEMIENIVDTEDITDFSSDKEYFGLKVKGNSMEPDYKENDTLICEKCEDIESGQICVVVINNDTAVLKKLVKAQNGIILYSLNPNYEPLVFSNTENIKVLAKVIEIRRKV